jgi:hypothetical protein
VVITADGARIEGAISWGTFQMLQIHGRQFDVLEPIFQAAKIETKTPLFVVTAIVHGRPRIDGEFDFTPPLMRNE